MRSKKVITNIISSVILQSITIICGLILPSIIIKAYGSNVNGLIVSIGQFLAYITLLEAGVGPVIKSLLYKPIAEKDTNSIAKILKASEKFFRIIAIIFLVYIFVLCCIIPLFIIKEFTAIFTVSLIIIVSISIFAEYFFGLTYKLFLQANQKNYVISLIQVSTLILNTILVVVLVKLKMNVQIVKLASSLIFVLRPILQNIYFKRKYLSINLKSADKNYKIPKKWDGLAQHIAYVIHNNTDIVILTLFTNLKEVSVYSIYLMITNSIKNIVEAFTGGIDATFGDMFAKREIKNLNNAFKEYETLYFTISTVFFSTTLFLILPFVSLYTKGIADVNYSRPLFAILIVLSKFVITIRKPYNDLIKMAGHFKETRIGAWIEAFSNIFLSLILVIKYGLVGVAIGTLVAIIFRTIEFMYHASKYILKRNFLYTFKYLFVIFLEFIVITAIIMLIPKVEISGYVLWIINAIIVFIISSSITIIINGIFYKENIKNVLNRFKLMTK